MKRTFINLLAIISATMLLSACLTMGYAEDAYVEPSLDNLTKHTYFENTKTNVAGNPDGGWVWACDGSATQSGYYMSRYENVRLTISGDKASMINQYLLQFGPDSSCISANNWGLTLNDGENVITLPLSSFTLSDGINLNKFRPDTCKLLIETKNGTATDVCDISVKVEFLPAGYYEEPSLDDLTVHTYLTSTKANVAGGISSWVWAHESGTPVQSPYYMSCYEKVKLTISGDKASMVDQYLLALSQGDAKMSKHVWPLTLKDGENVITLALTDFTLTDGLDLATFRPDGIEFLIQTNNGKAADVCDITVKVEFLPEEIIDPATVETHTLYKKTALVDGGQSSWVDFNGGTFTKPEIELENYKKLRIIVAAHKAGMVREILLQLGPTNACYYYSNWNLNLEADKLNVIEVDIADVINAGATEASEISILLHTDKEGFTDKNHTNLTVAVQLVGGVDEGWEAEFDDIDYTQDPADDGAIEVDPTGKKTHTLYMQTAVVDGGQGSWVWMDDGVFTKPAVALGNYSKIRIILAAHKAEMVREILVQVGDDTANYYYHNYSTVAFANDVINVKEFTLDELSKKGEIDLDTFIPEDWRFLIQTNKDGYSYLNHTNMLVAIQLVGENDECWDELFADFDFTSDPADDPEDTHEEPSLENLTNHTFLNVTKTGVAGGSSAWIWMHEGGTVVQSDFYMARYSQIVITVSGDKASIIDQYLIKLSAARGSMTKHVYPVAMKDGENVIAIPLSDLELKDIPLDKFRPDAIEFLIQTNNGTADDVCDITVDIEFVACIVREDFTLTDFSYKGGVTEDKENNAWVEERGILKGVFDANGCTITVMKNDGRNGQMWLTTGGRWRDQQPSGVGVEDIIFFNDFGSVDLEFYVEDANYIENILITLGTGDMSTSGAYLQKVIGFVTQNGHQHLRFNLDSMTLGNGFDWNVYNRFVSIELVVTVRAGTPEGTQINFKGISFNKEKTEPTIDKNDGFVLSGTTGSAIDLKAAATATHPFEETLAVSYGVAFAKTLDGETVPVSVADGVFTPYKAGFYFVKITATDSMGASAILELTIEVTGEDIDTEAPSVSFGSVPQYMPKPGTVDLSVIKVTDDIDTDIVPVITVTDENGNELSIVDGKVEITAPGSYTVTVKATDKAGHEKTLTRTITVEGESQNNPTDTSSTETTGCFGGVSATATGFALISLAVAILKKKRA